jgi:ferredoxin
VALDTVEASIIGFSVEDVPSLRIARELHLGETDLKAIEVMGDASTIEEYHRPTPPESSYSYKAGVGSGRTSREYFRQRVSYRPAISAETCQHQQGCAACVDICPSGALTQGPEMPALDASMCMICCACMEACDFSSLELLPDEKLMASLPK